MTEGDCHCKGAITYVQSKPVAGWIRVASRLQLRFSAAPYGSRPPGPDQCLSSQGHATGV
jgi:hypothetical protein